MKPNNTPLLLQGGLVIDSQLGTSTVQDILIEGNRISRIAPQIVPNSQMQVISCNGLIVTPGYIDAHVHIESSMVLPQAFGSAVLPFGTTSVIADPHELVNVAGADGLTQFLDEASVAPIDIFTVMPSSVPATPYDTNGAGKFLAEDMKPFLNRPDIVGLGEVMCFKDVVNHEKEILDKIALFRGKVIDGHTAGMSQDMLKDYAAANVQNDHECIDEEAVLQRYELGMNIYIREGSAASNARELLTAVKKNKLDLQKFAFCTDDKHLATIASQGHISYIVKMARSMGFGWGEIARMASFNPCRYYHLAERGNLREGYLADIVVTDDAGEHVRYVIKSGKLVARDEKLLIEVPRSTKTYANTVHFKDLRPEQFSVPDYLKHTAIALVDGQLITHRVTLKDEEYKSLPLLATLCRHKRGKVTDKIAVCPIQGYGIRNGAVATSVSHDSHNVVCAGDNPEDMALACNRLKVIGGGYVVVSQGKVLGEFPLPAYGLMSLKDAATAAQDIEEVEKIAHSLGVNRRIDAFITLSFVALPVIPSIRLLDTGLFDVTTNTFIREDTLQ